MIAHIRKSDRAEQTAVEHCKNVARLSGSAGERVGLLQTATLCGLLHDMGKFTLQFEQYIKADDQNNAVYHSPTGAIYIYETFYGGSPLRRFTAQIVSLVIRGHHGGLPDCVDSESHTPYLNCIKQDKTPLCYSEAVENFHSLCMPPDGISELFDKACAELEPLLCIGTSGCSFRAGMLARYLLSCVVDADRWDSACFENKADPFEKASDTPWNTLVSRLDNSLAAFPCNSDIGQIRAGVSRYCKDNAIRSRGMYNLTVPTGGGKTLSSLRFALHHLVKNNMKRIFYVIPYNTILEQNSKDIRESLGDYDGILEHFGNFVSDKEGDEAEREEYRHQYLTERWDSSLIMTSMVQFLNAVYKGGNTNARRFNRLADSVIIFDEIQALPKKCTVMFEKAVMFLCNQLRCTVLLCTATQPELELQTVPLIPDDYLNKMKKQLNRVSIYNYATEVNSLYSYEAAADRLTEKADAYRSVLMIVNTKTAANEIFRLVSEKLPEDCLKVHLSTSMTPAHRTEIINPMKEYLLDNKPVVCVSTALVEAGVNISFPCVIRSLAGLPSIIQSAGRCNRHMEMGVCGGRVEVWYLRDERLQRLEEIRRGQDIVKQIIGKHGSLTVSDNEMKLYFSIEREENTKGSVPLIEYKCKGKENSLYRMISTNKKYLDNCRRPVDIQKSMVMYQAFSEVGKHFEVIDEDTVSVIVQHGKGEALVTELCGELDLKTRIRKTREAQTYAVSLYRSAFNKMLSERMVFPVGDTGFYALKKEYYNSRTGITSKPELMDNLSF